MIDVTAAINLDFAVQDDFSNCKIKALKAFYLDTNGTPLKEDELIKLFESTAPTYCATCSQKLRQCYCIPEDVMEELHYALKYIGAGDMFVKNKKVKSE